MIRYDIIQLNTKYELLMHRKGVAVGGELEMSMLTFNFKIRL